MFLGVFLAALGISGAKCAIENSQMKRNTRTVDKDGNVHYMDRLCNDYINGERVQRVETTDANGVKLYSTVGVSSHKIYDTSYGRGTQQLLEYSEHDKQQNLKYGYNSYTQYNPYFGKFVTAEISSGRTITCLFSGKNRKTGKEFYRVWYFRPECQGKLDYNVTVDGDMGIEITKEEFNKLKFGSLKCSGMPSDYNVTKALWGEL